MDDKRSEKSSSAEAAIISNILSLSPSDPIAVSSETAVVVLAESATVDNTTENRTTDNGTIFRPHFDDAFVVTVWTLMLIYAFTANILVLIGIFRSRSLLKATSYWLIVSLSICDVFMIIISLIHIVPATLWHERFVETMSWRNIWAIFFYDLFWYTGVLKLGLMAGNRFVSIVYPNAYVRVFSRDRTLQIIGLVYLSGLAVSLPTLFPCCHTVYNSRYYVTMYVPPETRYSYVDIAVNSVSLLTMIVCYGVIIWKVRESRRALARYKNATLRRNTQTSAAAVTTVMLAATTATAGRSSVSAVTTAVIGGGPTINDSSNQQRFDINKNKDKSNNKGQRRGASTITQGSSIRSNNNNDGTGNRPPRRSVSKRETRLFLQFFLVSMVFLLTWATWQWLPRISESKWVFFLLTSFFFINNGVNPTVYLIFNTTLRREVVRTVCGNGSSSSKWLGAVHRRLHLHDHQLGGRGGGGRRGNGAEVTTNASGDRRGKNHSQRKRLGSRATTRGSCYTRDSATTSSSQPCGIPSSCVGTSKISDNSQQLMIPVNQLGSTPSPVIMEQTTHLIPPTKSLNNEYNIDSDKMKHPPDQYQENQNVVDSKVLPTLTGDKDPIEQCSTTTTTTTIAPVLPKPVLTNETTPAATTDKQDSVHCAVIFSTQITSNQQVHGGNNGNADQGSWHFIESGVYNNNDDEALSMMDTVGHQDITLIERDLSKEDIVVFTSTV